MKVGSRYGPVVVQIFKVVDGGYTYWIEDYELKAYYKSATTDGMRDWVRAGIEAGEPRKAGRYMVLAPESEGSPPANAQTFTLNYPEFMVSTAPVEQAPLDSKLNLYFEGREFGVHAMSKSPLVSSEIKPQEVVPDASA